MINRKANPVGIDYVIDELQLKLSDQLLYITDWAGYESYHRAYKNKKNGDTVPEIYITDENHKDVLFDNKKKVSSFFLSEDERGYDVNTGLFTQDISLIFQAQLNKIYPLVTTRADEEMIQDIILGINKAGWKNRLKKITTGVDNVYKSLDISGERKYLDDMGNRFVCRFDFNVQYATSIDGCAIIIA